MWIDTCRTDTTRDVSNSILLEFLVCGGGRAVPMRLKIALAEVQMCWHHRRPPLRNQAY